MQGQQEKQAKQPALFDVHLDRLTIVGDLVKNNKPRRERQVKSPNDYIIEDDREWHSSVIEHLEKYDADVSDEESESRVSLDWDSPLQFLIDTSEHIRVLTNFGTRTTMQIFGDKVYVELNSKENFRKRQFRMDFNPNNLSEDEISFLKENLLKHVRNADFTRVDIAFDCEHEMSDFHIIEKNPTKRSMYIGRNGKLETLYLGTRNSNDQVRIYNKNQESKDKQSIADEETGEVIGSKFIPPSDRKGQTHETWWRVEFTLKRDEILVLRAQNQERNVFDGLSIVKPDYKSVEKVNERAMLFYLKQHPEEWGNLNRRTKKKYEELLIASASEDITELFRKAYTEKRADLQHEIVKWLSATQKNPIK